MNQKHPPIPNVQVRHIPDPNPWETLESIPHMPTAGGVMLSLLLVACAAYQLPFSPPVYYTLPLLLACILALLCAVRSVAVGVASGALFVGGYVFGGFSLEAGLALLCPILIMGLGAYLISTYRSRWLVLIPVAAYVVAFVMCRDVTLSLLSLIAFPAAGILAHQTMRNQSRVSAICMTTLIYGLCLAFGYVLLARREGVTISFDAMATMLDATREQIIDATLSTEPLMQMLDKAYAGTGLASRDVVVSLVNLIFNMLPGMVIVLINLMTYTAQLTCTRAYVGTGAKQLLSRTAQLFILSIPAGLIYIFCLAVSLFSGASNIFTAVVHNLLIILLPGMTLVGIFKLAADLKHGISRLWMLILIGCAIIAPYMLILCISFSGALTTVSRPLVARMILKNQGKDGPTDPRDPD